MKRSEEYLARAEEARMRAEGARDGVYRRQMLRVAEQWRTLAGQVDAMEALDLAPRDAPPKGH